MADELYDFGSSFASTVAPAIGTMGFSAGMAAAGPIGVAVGVLSALGGRSKRRRRRRAARRQRKAQQKEASYQAVNIGMAAGQQAGAVVAAGTQMGGTIAPATIQTQMADAFLSQQRTLKSVGLSRKQMVRARDKALARERARKFREARMRSRRTASGILRDNRENRNER